MADCISLSNAAAKTGENDMSAVLISIRPEWCEKIASGQKTIEVRKTRPKLEPPFRCYIYCTTGSPYLNRHNGIMYLEKLDILGNRGNGLYERLNGLVIGEFVCDRIQKTFEPAGGLVDVIDCRQSCLTAREIIRYADGKALYFWHISNLKIYDTPKELIEFHKLCTSACNFSGECGGVQDGEHCPFPLKRPPQSWCYVE